MRLSIVSWIGMPAIISLLGLSGTFATGYVCARYSSYPYGLHSALGMGVLFYGVGFLAAAYGVAENGARIVRAARGPTQTRYVMSGGLSGLMVAVSVSTFPGYFHEGFRSGLDRRVSAYELQLEQYCRDILSGKLRPGGKSGIDYELPGVAGIPIGAVFSGPGVVYLHIVSMSMPSDDNWCLAYSREAPPPVPAPPWGKVKHLHGPWYFVVFP